MADTTTQTKTRAVKPFLDSLKGRLAKLSTIAAKAGAQYARAGQGSTEFDAITQALSTVATKVAALPADFKPAKGKRAKVAILPGMEVFISEKKRPDLYDLMDKAAVDGAWSVTKVTDKFIAVTSKVNGSASTFNRGDVQIAAQKRNTSPLSPEQKAKRVANLEKARAARKAGAGASTKANGKAAPSVDL